jgi:hypothetical protein
MYKTLSFLLLSSLLVLGIGAQQPDPAAMASAYGQDAQQNAALMRQYGWKMRVEVTVKDEIKPAKMYQMRFDADGKPQKTLLTAEKKQKKKRGVRGRVQKKKTKAMKEWAGELADVVKTYTTATPGTMLDFYAKAKMTLETDGTVKIAGTEFMQSGDTATFWLDQQTKRARRFSFTTILDGDPMTGEVQYARVPAGPSYAAQTVISVPAKKVRAKVETFDYAKQ